MSKKPTVLMILDGYGLNDHKEGNAVLEGKTPVMDKLMAECPFVKGNASGMAAVSYTHLDVYKRQVVRDDLSPESLESPENDICDRNDVDGTDFGSIREPGVCKDDFFIKRAESGRVPEKEAG